MSAPADEVTFDVKDRFMAACTTKRTAAGRAVLVEAMRRRELRCTRAVRVAAVTLLCARRIGWGMIYPGIVIDVLLPGPEWDTDVGKAYSDVLQDILARIR